MTHEQLGGQGGGVVFFPTKFLCYYVNQCLSSQDTELDDVSLPSYSLDQHGNTCICSLYALVPTERDLIFDKSILGF